MKRIILTAKVSNLEELRDAIRQSASKKDFPVTYVFNRDGEDICFELEEETLSDGSKVYNVILF